MRPLEGAGLTDLHFSFVWRPDCIHFPVLSHLTSSRHESPYILYLLQISPLRFDMLLLLKQAQPCPHRFLSCCYMSPSSDTVYCIAIYSLYWVWSPSGSQEGENLKKLKGQRIFLEHLSHEARAVFSLPLGPLVLSSSSDWVENDVSDGRILSVIQHLVSNAPCLLGAKICTEKCTRQMHKTEQTEGVIWCMPAILQCKNDLLCSICFNSQPLSLLQF